MPGFEIAGRVVPPGSREMFELPVARLATQNMVQLPVAVLHGVSPGPTLFVTAAVHGDELNGTEVARLLIHDVRPEVLSGTLIVLPIVNVIGFIQGDRYLPDRRDLNRHFPGSARGSLASQLAYLVTKEVVSRSTHGIDLHGGSLHRTNYPQVRGDLRKPAVEALGAAFGAPVLLHAPHRGGSLRSAAAKAGIPVVVYEAGEPMRMEHDAIRVGLDGVKRVLGQLGMIEDPPATAGSLVCRESTWHRAPQSGIARIFVRPGERVQRGTFLAEIGDAFGIRAAVAKSRVDGVVVGLSRNPVVSRGDAIVHVAEVD